MSSKDGSSILRPEIDEVTCHSPLEVNCRPNLPQLESAHPVVRELYKMDVFEATFKEFLPRRGKIDWECLVDDWPEETLNDTKMARIMKLYARYLLALEIYFCRRCIRYPYVGTLSASAERPPEELLMLGSTAYQLYSGERPRKDAAALKACLEDLDAIMFRRYPDRDEIELPLMED